MTKVKRERNQKIAFIEAIHGVALQFFFNVFKTMKILKKFHSKPLSLRTSKKN